MLVLGRGGSTEGRGRLDREGLDLSATTFLGAAGAPFADGGVEWVPSDESSTSAFPVRMWDESIEEDTLLLFTGRDVCLSSASSPEDNARLSATDLLLGIGSAGGWSLSEAFEAWRCLGELCLASSFSPSISESEL